MIKISEIEELLEKTRHKIASQGRIVDDLLLRRERNLECVLSRSEAIQARTVSLQYLRKSAPIKIDLNPKET